MLTSLPSTYPQASSHASPLLNLSSLLFIQLPSIQPAHRGSVLTSAGKPSHPQDWASTLPETNSTLPVLQSLQLWVALSPGISQEFLEDRNGFCLVACIQQELQKWSCTSQFFIQRVFIKNLRSVGSFGSLWRYTRERDKASTILFFVCVSVCWLVCF